MQPGFTIDPVTGEPQVHIDYRYLATEAQPGPFGLLTQRQRFGSLPISMTVYNCKLPAKMSCLETADKSLQHKLHGAMRQKQKYDDDLQSDTNMTLQYHEHLYTDAKFWLPLGCKQLSLTTSMRVGVQKGRSGGEGGGGGQRQGRKGGVLHVF